MKKLYTVIKLRLQSLYQLTLPGIFKGRNYHFKKLALLICGCIFLMALNNRLYAAVNLTTSTVAAGNITQGTNNNVVYVVKMDVTTTGVTVNNIQFVLNGTYDNNDLSLVSVWFNATAPTTSGGTLLSNQSGLFAGPHTFSAGLNQGVAAAASGYFIITISTAAGATNGNTVKIDGAANPVVFGFTTSPTITDNQTNAAGIQTIQAPGATLTTSTSPAGNISQGTNNNIVYAAKMDITGLPVTVNSIQFVLDGTYDNNDLSLVSVWFNATAPTITGGTLFSNQSGLFAGPHTFNASLNNAIAAGASGYFIITVSTASGATNGNTVKIDGAANPVVFGFTTSPIITNNQTNAAGTQTIQAANVTLTSSPVAAGNIAQGTNNNIVYAAKMDVTVLPVTVNSIQFVLDGTYDNNDLSLVSVWFNATAPTITGGTLFSNQSGLFAGPHTFNASLNNAIAAGASGYFIITVSTAAGASNGNTIKIDGAANPVVFGFTTSPIITNNQTNAAGTKTITGVLPVTLISFSAKNIQNKVHLNWVTASELNNAFFEIERSSDGRIFDNLAKIDGNGTSALAHDYNYVDESPAYGINYYRLKQIDIDGHSTYSKVVEVTLSVTEIMITNVYPNPVKTFLKYTIISPEKKELLLQLLDISGRVLVTKKVSVTSGINSLQLDVSEYESGNYRLSVVDIDAKNRIVKSIVIVR